jgi:Domain of unknown function (DUF4160)
MPVVSMFYGIVVLMYYFDNKKHHQPHVHVESGDDEAVISKLRLIQAWIEIHQEELMKDWHLAVTGQAIFRIEPLR